MLFEAAASGALVRLRICVAWDAQPEVDMASLSLRMRDVITRFWYGLLDEDQVSALSDAGGWVALQDRYVHRACRLLVIL